MVTKESALAKISELVLRFEEQYDSYKKADYNETLTRRDFIDPFFKALGWDIDNEQGYAESYREVIHEDKIKIGKATKAPDYSFRLAGGKRLFFVEAKKPSVFLKDDVLPAYQVRRYGWNAKLDVSIISDFEEFAIYDCTRKPNPSDKASVARIRYFTFREYIKEFDFIWQTFSKENVLKGSFDKFVKGNANKKGTATVDKEFLVSLDHWRTLLAENIAKQNKALDEDEINYVVQQTLDRIIFLRIAEARGIEPEDNMLSAIKEGEYYHNLFSIFKDADDKYNSGLFDFKKDKISKSVVIDNKVLKSVITELYYPISPYEFSVLAVEILGSAYEQFLGKVIRIDANHKARIEEKPEVRKAGGVYYTPQYIVDYIVQHTIGKLVEGKTPAQVSKLTIVDPACGSGSFLLGAYSFLLDWHRNYYSENGKISKGKKDDVLTPSGNLTTAEKKRILTNNIYGVDIDTNAVEVTKLSLLLKCMEGETQASIAHQLAMFHERVLPTLENNIKSGNSLIDTDYYDSELDFGEEKKIKPFNWKKAFPEVFNVVTDKRATIVNPDFGINEDRSLGSRVEEPLIVYETKSGGGFDVVIGNPPYVRQELLGEQKKYFETHYRVYHGMADLFTYFIEKGIGLLKPGGFYGVIVANKWMRAKYGEPLRKWLKDQSIHEIIDFGDLPVFDNVTTYPCILIAGKTDSKNKTFCLTLPKTLDFPTLDVYVRENVKMADKKNLEDSGWNLAGDAEQKLLKKIQDAGIPLEKYVNGKIFRGVLTGLNEAFVIDEETKNKLIKEDKKSAEVIKPFLAGRDIKRHQKPSGNKFLIFTRRGIDIEKYPAIKAHLLQFKKQLMPKPKDFKGGNWEGRKPGTYKWYEIQDSVDYYEEFEKPKIIIPAIVQSASYAFDTDGYYSNDKTSIIPTEDLFLLGLISSKCLDFFLKSIASTKQGGYFEYKPMYISKLPIAQKVQASVKSKIFNDVKEIMKLKEEVAKSKIDSQVDHLQTKIDHIEERINKIVYELYDLTADEIKIIEANSK